ncbi:MAG: hypothetical protein H6Q25_250 [Bacteroidetes bacterium]|nr:hypothetical protein [Bacteroidota bacterium]
MKLSKYFYLILFVLFLYGCKEKTNQKAALYFEGNIAFKLSETTSHAGILKIFPFKDSNIDYISIFDGPFKTLYIYTLKDQKMVKKIVIKDSLFDAYDASLYINNLDSIFILEMFKNNLYLIDSNGNTIQKIKIRNKELIDFENKKGNIYIPFPCDASNSNGFYFFENKIYLSSTGNSTVDYSNNCKDIYVINLLNQKSELTFQKPQIYYNGYWGNNFQHSLQLTFISETKQFIVSYGADHYVYETDFKTNNKKHMLKSRYLLDLKPYGYNKPSSYLQDPSIEKYNYCAGSYSNTYYDDKNKKFLRFVNLPYTDQQYNEEMKTGFQPLKRSVIITDNKFNYITEIILDEKITIPVFIYDGKLYFNDSDSYRKNQDSIYFKKYSIKL